jgi:hypothetical protein
VLGVREIEDLLLFLQNFLIDLTLVAGFTFSSRESAEKRLEGVADARPDSISGSGL